jgi:hypothetical protein
VQACLVVSNRRSQAARLCNRLSCYLLLPAVAAALYLWACSGCAVAWCCLYPGTGANSFAAADVRL